MQQKLTAREAQGRLENLFDADEPSVERVGYREAASVLSTFRLENLRPVGGKTSPSATAEFSADCELTTDEIGTESWVLLRAIRRETLIRLVGDGRLKEARSANQGNGPLQEILDAAMEAKLAGRESGHSFADLPSLRFQLTVSDWVEGILPAQPAESIRAEIRRLQLLEPFKELVGEHFAGRKAELAGLADYAGIFGAASVGEAFRRGVESVFSVHERPPLFLHGPGGIGKSTLIARFVLDHALKAEQDERFPYAYLDFDRTSISPQEPITLLHEAIRQISLQYAWMSQTGTDLWNHWRQRMAKQDSVRKNGTAGGVFRLDNRQFYLDSFVSFVNSLKMDHLPLLLVLDTFEEVQYRAASYMADLFTVLNEVQERVPRTRLVVCGRDLPKVFMSGGELKLRPLQLGEFDQEAAIAFLQNRGVQPKEVAVQVVDQVGHSPLVLRMAADLWKSEHLTGKIEGLDTGFLARLRGKRIETQLYTRFLLHIHDDEVRKLAYPGLVLRKINAPLILEVLAGPCDVEVSGLPQASALLEKLRREFTLVTPDPADRNTVIHRPDVRSLMLRDLVEGPTRDSVRKIHENAVRYYSSQSGREAWAEQMYHRLSQGVDREALRGTDWDGFDQLLPMSAILELPPESQRYLAAQLPIEFDEKIWSLLDTADSGQMEDWEGYRLRLMGDAERTGHTSDVQRRLDSIVASARNRRSVPDVLPLRADQLDGPARSRLRDGLMQSFPAVADLARWISAALNQDLWSFVSPGLSYVNVAFELVNWANAQGWIDKLAKAAVEEFPQNQNLYDVAQRMGLTSLSYDAMHQATGGLEAVLPMTLLNPAMVREHLGRAERQVCRVEVGNAMGTGFLVNECVVLFPAHLLPEHSPAGLSRVRFRFDYSTRSGGVVPDGDELPALDLIAWDPKLDYAAARTTTAATGRGWLPLSPNRPHPGDPLMILHYPQGRPLLFGIENNSVTGFDSAKGQLLYKMATDVGSSGAPCMNLEWSVVAMHLGQRESGNNYAVPMTALIENLQRLGIALSK